MGSSGDRLRISNDQQLAADKTRRAVLFKEECNNICVPFSFYSLTFSLLSDSNKLFIHRNRIPPYLLKLVGESFSSLLPGISQARGCGCELP